MTGNTMYREVFSVWNTEKFMNSGLQTHTSMKQ